MSSGQGDQQLRVDMAAFSAAALARWMRILIVTVLALAVTAGLLFFIPRTYESTARLIVESAPSASAADTSARVASQVELIKSRDLLLKVMDRENLRSELELTNAGFSPFSVLMDLIGQGERRSLDEVVLTNLAGRTTVARERDSSVISVTVRAGDPQLAARIANGLARTHVEGWAARQAADAAAATSRLEQEIEDLRAKVRAADAAVASYKLEHGFTTTSIPLPPVDGMSATAAQIAEAQQRKESAEARASEIRALLASGGDLGAVADLRDSMVIAALLQSRAGLEAELTQKQTTLLPNHPTIKALKSQINQLTGQISAEATKVAASLEQEAKAAAELEQRLRADAAREDAAAGDAAQASVDLEWLEREAKAQRDLLDSYLAKYADLVAANSSRDARQDIRIISDAAPALEPASPNYLIVMAGVGFAAFALQLALVLLGQAAQPVRSEDPDKDHKELAAFVAEPDSAPQADMAAEAAGENEPELPFEQEPDYPAPVRDETDDLLEHAVEHAVATQAGSHAGLPLMEDQMSDLSEAVGEHGIVLLLSVGEGGGRAQVVQRLLEDALLAQYSAVVIDAGSGQVSESPGITDLAMGMIDYGEALQRIDDSLAEVQWGTLPVLDRRSLRPLTLVEALADIYHLVVVDTGYAGLTSSLPLFSGAPATVMLIATDQSDAASLAAAERDVAALGFQVGRIVDFSEARAEVA